jgi:hypothetical protein
MMIALAQLWSLLKPLANLVSSIVYTIAIPFGAIATTYLYFDCFVRERLEPVERKPVETLPAEI